MDIRKLSCTNVEQHSQFLQGINTSSLKRLNSTMTSPIKKFFREFPGGPVVKTVYSVSLPIFIFYLFIFGCIGSSLLHGLSLVAESGG